MAKPAMLLLLVGAHALVPTPVTRQPTKLHSTKQDNVVECGRRGRLDVRRDRRRGRREPGRVDDDARRAGRRSQLRGIEG